MKENIKNSDVMSNIGKKPHWILCILFLIFASTIYGQNLAPIVLDGYVASRSNPSYVSDKKWELKFGETAFHISTGGVSLNELVSNDGVLSFGNSDGGLRAKYPVMFDLNFHTFDLNYKFGSVNISIGHAWKSNAVAKFSNGLVDLISQGNAPFVGQSLPLEIREKYDAYNEVYFGLSKQIKKWSIGIRLKLLNGVDNIWTEKGKIDLTTSIDDFSISTSNDVSIYSNGVFEASDIGDASFDLKGFGLNSLFRKNFGFGGDIGFGYQINKKTDVFAALNDIGFINWEGGQNFTNNRNGTFKGVDIIDQIVNGDPISIVDSLYSVVDFDVESQNYRVNILGQGVFGFRHQFNDKYEFGIDGAGTFVFGKTYLSSVRLQGVRSFGKQKIGASLSYQNGSNFNPGIFGIYQYRRFAIYGTADNFLSLIFPKDFSTVGARLGLKFGV